MIVVFHSHRARTRGYLVTWRADLEVATSSVAYVTTDWRDVVIGCLSLVDPLW